MEFNHLEKLRELRDQIQSRCSADTFADYIHWVRRWLTGRVTLEAFDQRARSTVPVELHTQFLVSIMTGLQDFSTTPITVPTNSATRSDACTIMGDDVGSGTVCGWLPDPRTIHAYALTIALENDVDDGVDTEVSEIVFEHIKTVLSNLFEAILKMSRSHLSTESGLTHSYGVQKLKISSIPHGNGGASAASAYCCIIPAKSAIDAEDILDVFDLESQTERCGAILPHATLRSRLIKRLENAVNGK